MIAAVLGLAAWAPSAGAAETRLVGSSTVESQADSSGAGEAEAFSQVAVASGVAEVASIYIGASNAAKTVVVGVYSSNGAHAGTLLGTGSATASAAGTWTTMPIGHVAITAGATYWLAILGVGGSLHYRDHPGGSCASESSSQSGLTALASAWKTGSAYRDCPGSVYVSGGGSPPPAAPVNSVLPAISGSAVEGQTLSASSGTWSGSPSSYAYQWQDCNALGEGCLATPGGSASAYKLGAGDVGSRVRVLVSATNAGGSATASSQATTVVVAKAPAAPVNSVLPAISGSAVEGQTLSASSGTWSGSPSSYAYQWQDCNTLGESCVAVGAGGPSYKLGAGDVGKRQRVTVRATNAGGSAEATSAASGVVVAAPPPPAAPVNSVLPAVSGSAVEGQTLSASSGTWSGGPSYAYQWLSCNGLGEACAKLAGSTGASLKLGSSNVGGTVRVVVTATNSGGSAEATSAASGVVVAAPPPPAEPVLLIGTKTAHSNAGDSKAEEITPLKFTALKSGVLEELCFETGGYLYAPSETSLVLGIQEDISGRPGRVLGEGTFNGTLGLSAVAKVSGLSVPVTAGSTYFLSFLPLGGSVTYWYGKSETVIYSEHHKALEEGPPQNFVWQEEAEEAPIGMWGMGSEG